VPLKRIERLLKERIGLHAESIGTSALQIAVRTRMSASGASTQQAYVERLSRPDELNHLIDEIVVRETWFFREPAAFTLLRERFAPPRVLGRPCRLLSIPCATGEEPYSIAMCLLRAGMGASDFEVHGADVSQRSIELAQRATYGSHSFRMAVAGYDEYFERTPHGLTVKPDVRARVSLQEGNLLDPNLYLGVQFDAIFCRNLLIYFDRDARAAALANLRRLLREDGVLFAGHSEALQFVEAGFRGVGDAGCFAFERARTEPSQPARAPTSSLVRGKPVPRPAQESQRSKRHSTRATARTSKAPTRRPSRKPASLRPSASLDDARALADRGELAAAQKCCESHLAAKGPSADGFCLLGVIKQASGDSQGALESFNKAVYMDASHYEALSHIALLYEHAGDKRAAGYWRQRAQSARKEKT
jgi:chemotaxis protein methyltransferase WspC